MISSSCSNLQNTISTFSRLFSRKKFVELTFGHKIRKIMTGINYGLREYGRPHSAEYRCYIEMNGSIISPFHDIKLYPYEKNKKIINTIIEIPRYQNAKVEICVNEKFNPLKHDIKNGKVRYVKNIFPFHGYPWNYGAIPQTWENPKLEDKHTKKLGDDDPLDVCEIGEKIHKCGSVVQVKVLGVMALIDEGETDWKILAIDVTDPMADKLNDISDVEKLLPGFIKGTRQWLTSYKVPDNKGENEFAFNGEPKDADFAYGIIEETHQQWTKLHQTESLWDKRKCENTTLVDSKSFKDPIFANSEANKNPKFEQLKDTICSSVDRQYFVIDK